LEGPGFGQTREFDEAAALDVSMDCFWRHGYGTASVRDLAARMGITGSSLFNVFDKRSLFRQVLQRYAEQSTGARIARLESTLLPKDASTKTSRSRFSRRNRRTLARSRPARLPTREFGAGTVAR